MALASIVSLIVILTSVFTTEVVAPEAHVSRKQMSNGRYMLISENISKHLFTHENVMRNLIFLVLLLSIKCAVAYFVIRRVVFQLFKETNQLCEDKLRKLRQQHNGFKNFLEIQQLEENLEDGLDYLSYSQEYNKQAVTDIDGHETPKMRSRPGNKSHQKYQVVISEELKTKIFHLQATAKKSVMNTKHNDAQVYNKQAETDTDSHESFKTRSRSASIDPQKYQDGTGGKLVDLVTAKNSVMNMKHNLSCEARATKHFLSDSCGNNEPPDIHEPETASPTDIADNQEVNDLEKYVLSENTDPEHINDVIKAFVDERSTLIKDQQKSRIDKISAHVAETFDLQVTAETSATDKENKLSNNDKHFQENKNSTNPKLFETVHQNAMKRHPEQLNIRAIYFFGAPETIKLMQPPQNERDRQSTFDGVRCQSYSSEEFSRGGFYFIQNDMVKCHSCHVKHHISDIEGRPPTDGKWHKRTCRHALRFWSIPPRNNIPFPCQEVSEPRDDIAEQVATNSKPRSKWATDGAVSDNVSEAPGQRSTYIPPGDSRKEIYRLSTFENYPNTDANIRKALASHGFYFTGFSDQVKCFNCARSVVRWISGDNPADPKWHKPTCQFIRGDPCGNIPIRNVFGDLAARIAPSPSPSVSAETVLQQRDPTTGALIRTVRYPADLPERLRQQGGTFTIGPNNELHIQSGPVRRPDFPTGSRDPPPHSTMQTSTTRNAVVNPPQPRAPVPTWRMANVASSDHKRFLTNLYLNRELDRLTSFARWPTDRPNVPPSALAKTGFYYLGDMDRVQCFSCGGVLRNWTLDDSAEREHRTHFGGCNMVLGNEPLNIPIPSSPESPELLATNYPLRFPSNPHMRGQAQRESTFDRRWPTGRINVSIEQIAEAGFFYLGERDRVKCWYCNGGLQNWEFDDVPWDEHAKWFPNCQFLLRMKGQRFVHHHLAPHAQLARPVIGRQDGSPLENIRRSPSTSRGYDIPPVQRRPPTPPPTIIDPQEETRKRKERVKNIMRNSETVRNVLVMGFSEQIVETVIEDRILSSSEATTNGVYGSVSELLDDVMKKEEEMKQEEEQRRNQMNSMVSNPSTFGSMMSSVSSLGPAPGSGKYNVSYFGDDDEMNDVDMYGSMEQGPSNRDETQTKELAGETTESLQQQLEKIEEERMCKICFSNVADMLFFPCSHMVCCMECTQAIRHCPICRKQIERAFKTYVK